MDNVKLLRDYLGEDTIRVMYPCRLDVSGTWDLKPFVLLYPEAKPSTVTIALNLFTTIVIKPCDDVDVRITDILGNSIECVDYKQMDLTGPFGFLLAAVKFFNVRGIDIRIFYGTPPRSGLGGSGGLLIGIIAALNKAMGSYLSFAEMIVLSSDIEDGLRYSYTGLQDQCAAIYGSVRHWGWTYDSAFNYEQTDVLEDSVIEMLSDRLLVAYTGSSHDSNTINKTQVSSLLSGKHVQDWLYINRLGRSFMLSVSRFNWSHACWILNEETHIRNNIVPERMNDVGCKLRTVALENSSGFAIAGAGNGGCVWALCPNDAIKTDVRSGWIDILDSVGGYIFNCGINTTGISVHRLIGNEV